ncbi:MAG: aminotransferase class V-fold PLP-dependent enzyme, partial [Hyphomicrobiaceae bacterium]
MAKSPSSSAQPRQFRPETLLVHGGTLRSDFREMSEALFLTQGYVYDSAEQAERRFNGEEPGFQYSRFSNPTISMFEQRMRLLEGAEDVRSCATGMAAVTASIIGYLSAGQHIVAAKAMFGSCRYIVEDLCPRFGIEFTLVDGADNDAWKQALRPNTRAFFFETPSNPTLEIIDIAAVSKIAHEAGAIVIVDNVFATPMQQKPLQHGADVVVYSATKHIDGQGRCLGGVVLGSSHLIRKYYHD